jgi:hypothetical protein
MEVWFDSEGVSLAPLFVFRGFLTGYGGNVDGLLLDFGGPNSLGSDEGS